MGSDNAPNSNSVIPFKFQSTLPVWGATRRIQGRGYAVRISIHAPRVGSDPLASKIPTPRPSFQSTLPVWGATEIFRFLRCGILDFNPRSPCGERLYQMQSAFVKSLFQSTLPVWGATPSAGHYTTRPSISIHAPRVGSDWPVCGSTARMFNFNPRSPCGERPGQGWATRADINISIHAPRVGSDLRKLVNV